MVTLGQELPEVRLVDQALTESFEAKDNFGVKQETHTRAANVAQEEKITVLEFFRDGSFDVF